MYLPSNDAIADIVRHDLDLHYQGLEMEFEYIKTVRASEKCSDVLNCDFLEVDICSQMGLRLLYSVTLIYFQYETNFSSEYFDNISWKKRQHYSFHLIGNTYWPSS